MYAIVEFLKGEDPKNKEYAVVPLIWLHNDNTACYWPRVKTDKDLAKLVEANAPYDKKWPKYNVHRVVKSSEAYDSLQQDLTEYLEQSTTDSDDTALQMKMITSKPTREQRIVSDDEVSPEAVNKSKPKDQDTKRKDKNKQRIVSDHEASPDTANKSKPKDQGVKRKHKNKSLKNKKSSSKKSKSGRNVPQSSASDDSSIEIADKENDTADEDMDEASIIKFSYPSLQATLKNITNEGAMGRGSKVPSSPKSPALIRSITGLQSITDNFQQNNESPILQASPLTSRTSQMRIHKFKGISQEEFQIEVLTRFRTLESEISQINTSLNQLARSSQFGKITPATKPDNFPSMPIETMADFKSFDVLLKEEIYETYFTNRLAAIGGINIRQGVMNILKFVLTNRVAMEFNWAGRDKKQPFQSTQMVKIITAAVKIAFPDSTDATDIQIASGIKDWLKQAKHRNACQEKKK